MDGVFFVCIVRRGAVGARVWEVRVFSSCICCMFVSCVHPVAVLNAEFGMTSKSDISMAIKRHSYKPQRCQFKFKRLEDGHLRYSVSI